MWYAADLIHNIIEKDRKSSTYKLGLLRSLYRIAYTIRRSENLINSSLEKENDFIHIPSGMVGLYWIRLYLPLFAANLPQNPISVRSSLAKGEFLELTKVPSLNLRLGNEFEDTMAILVHKSIEQVAEIISSNPVEFTTFNGESDEKPTKVFEMYVAEKTPVPQSLALDPDYLFQFGKFTMPQEIWQVLITGDNWLETAIVDKWVEMIENYLKPKKGRKKVFKHTTIDTEKIYDALRWIE